MTDCRQHYGVPSSRPIDILKSSGPNTEGELQWVVYRLEEGRAAAVKWGVSVGDEMNGWDGMDDRAITEAGAT